jgi:heme A synthase
MKLSAFAKYAWVMVAFTVFVILWGALVRATGSGAGCGNHWPTCQGAIIPQPKAIETVIEFTHRLTSSLAGVLAIGLVIWAFRAYPKGHWVRGGAIASLTLMIVEGLLGAALVKFELVAKNDSAIRALVVAVHLANTFILLAAVTLTAWWASGGPFPIRVRGQGALSPLVGLALLGVMAIGASGAIVALGDTLFLASSLIAGWEQDLDSTAHFLVRLRWVHPAIAIMVGVYVICLMAYYAWSQPMLKRLAQVLIGLVAVQLLAGAVNVLLLADSVWIMLVIVSAGLLATESLAPREPAGVPTQSSPTSSVESL